MNNFAYFHFAEPDWLWVAVAVGPGSWLGWLVAVAGVEVEGAHELVAAEDDDVVAVA